MRIYLKRLALFVIVGFCATIVLLSIPKSGEEREWNSKESANRLVPRPIPHRFVVDPKRSLPVEAHQPRGEKHSGSYYPEDRLSDSQLPYSHGLSDSERLIDFSLIDRLDRYVAHLDFSSLIARECPINETLREFWNRKHGTKVPERDSWESFYAHIGSCDLYRSDEVIHKLFNDLTTLPVKHVAIMEGGTQVKFIITFQNDEQAVFKPMRFGRDYESDPNHFYFSDFERHNAEIATFHLDKILGFRRAVPTVGRVFNITSELRDLAEKRLRRTFFLSPAKNHCFVSKCDYYCDTTHAVCGHPDMKEASVQVFLPDETTVPRKHNKSPYRRTYSKRNQLAVWQTNMNYCTWKVKTRVEFAHGRRLLDLVDLHIMDFLIGNQDRHHYETFAVFDTPSYAVHLDNGRAFGRTDIDDMDILLPLIQCCVIRPSTYKTLMRYYRGPISLTQALYMSMSKDPVAPILAPKHYPALERRLHKVMEALEVCFKQAPKGAEDVIMVEYHNPAVAENAAVDEGTEESEEEDKKLEAKADNHV